MKSWKPQVWFAITRQCLSRVKVSKLQKQGQVYDEPTKELQHRSCHVVNSARKVRYAFKRFQKRDEDDVHICPWCWHQNAAKILRLGSIRMWPFRPKSGLSGNSVLRITWEACPQSPCGRSGCGWVFGRGNFWVMCSIAKQKLIGGLEHEFYVSIY